jgi:hypothetical protein
VSHGRLRDVHLSERPGSVQSIEQATAQPPPPKKGQCKCCGQSRLGGNPECPNCGFIDWWLFVFDVAVSGGCASAFWFRTGGWTWVACGLGVLGVFGAIRCVWQNVRAVRRKAADR